MRVAAAATFLLCHAVPFGEIPLHAQTLNPRPPRVWSAPEWVGDVTFLGLNALSSGVSAGIIQRLHGGSFMDGFTRGALGGGIHYAGKRLSAQYFDGAGLLGRQVSAAGISMTRNAAEGRGTLEQMFFPIGPLHVHVRLADGVQVRPRVNISALAVLIAAAAQPELDWDAGASLSAGAPVFDAPGHRVISDGRTVGGYAAWGTIILSDVEAEHRPRLLAHERTHVLQHDWHFYVWSDPAEEWILDRVPAGPAIRRYVDVDLLAASVHIGFYGLVDVAERDRLYQIEASFLENR